MADEVAATPVALDHDDHVRDLLPVTSIHMRFELSEGIKAGLGCAFVDVVDDIGVQQCEHGFSIMSVEGVEIGFDEFARGHDVRL